MTPAAHPPAIAAKLTEIEEAIAYIDTELDDCGGPDVYSELQAERRRMINLWNSMQGLPEPYDDHDEREEE